MKLEDKFAVVTGGGSGIGLAITVALRAAGADVLVVGRDPERLASAQGRDEGITSFVADISHANQRDRLIEYLAGGRPVDVLVNNAGTMTDIDLYDHFAVLAMEDELALDLSAPIHLTTALLPGLMDRPEAAVVNVTTGLIYAPFGRTPGYATAKAGLHAFSQALRHQTRLDGIQVLEVLPPTVDTELTSGYSGTKIKPEVVGTAVAEALARGTTELRLGQTKFLYFMSRLAPNGIYSMMNKVADKVMATS